MRPKEDRHVEQAGPGQGIDFPIEASEKLDVDRNVVAPGEGGPMFEVAVRCGAKLRGDPLDRAEFLPVSFLKVMGPLVVHGFHGSAPGRVAEPEKWGSIIVDQKPLVV